MTKCFDEVVDLKKIKCNIERILMTAFHMQNKFLCNQNYMFLGLHGLLTPRDFTYLTYILEKEYKIHFTTEEYDNPKFCSVLGLTEIIAEKIGEKSAAGGENYKNDYI